MSINYKILVFIIIILLIITFIRYSFIDNDIENFIDNSWDNKYNMQYNNKPYTNNILPTTGDTSKWNLEIDNQKSKIYGNKILN